MFAPKDELYCNLLHEYIIYNMNFTDTNITLL